MKILDSRQRKYQENGGNKVIVIFIIFTLPKI